MVDIYSIAYRTSGWKIGFMSWWRRTRWPDSVDHAMTGSLHHVNVGRLMELTHTAEFVLLILLKQVYRC